MYVSKDNQKIIIFNTYSWIIQKEPKYLEQFFWYLENLMNISSPTIIYYWLCWIILNKIVNTF